MSIISSRLESSPKVHTAEPLQAMHGVGHLLGRVIDACFHLAVFLIPLFFATWTIDIIEINKQTLFILLTAVAGVAWIGKALAEKEFTLMRSWIHLVAVLFGLGYLLVSLFSQDRYLSFVGTLGQMPWSFTTIAGLIVFYVVGIHHVRSVAQVYDLVLTFLASTFLATIVALLQMFGVFLFPAAVTQTKAFTTVGSVFAFAVYLAAPMTIAASLLFHGCRNNVCVLGSEKPAGSAARVLLWGVLVLGLIALAIVNYWVAWLALLFGSVLTVGVGYLRNRSFGHPVKLAVPGVMTAVSLVFLVLALFKVPAPINLNIPSEVSPSAKASWDIARKTLERSPFFGSGPGTYIYDYARYRVPEVNLSPFWNIRFDRSFSFFLTLVATTGIVGTVLWLMLIVSGFIKAFQHLTTEKNEDVWYAYLIVFSGWATLVFLTFLYNMNMAHIFILWLLFMLLGSMVSQNSLTWDAKKHAYAYGLLSTKFIVSIVLGVCLSWLAGQRLVADAAFASAVNDFRAGASIDAVIAKVQRAASLNPFLDAYPRNLAQAHLVKAAQIIQQDQSRTDLIDVELKASIDRGMEAVSTTPANVDNYASLALLYQSIASFVRGADEQAIARYKQAIELEPENPVFLSEVGKLYLLRADAYRTVADKGTQDEQAQTRTNIEENLKLASDYLQRAIATKQDYLPARYYLGIVYERQGNVASAIAELENVLRINNRDVGVAFELAILYYRNNQKSQALDLMQQVVRIDPESANARWYLAAMYEEQQRYDEALAELRALAEKYPDNGAIQQRISSVESAKAAARPSVQPLPDPIRQDVSGPDENNPITP